jgi:hypothetical protein
MSNKLTEHQLENLSDLKIWKLVCERIMENEYPPTVSATEFSAETLQRDAQVDLSKMSNWTLVCEEILDTEFPPVYYQKCYDELLKRGKTADEIKEMREFAWMTAGWLNYAKMLWDWINLDETDIEQAVNWQFKGRAITVEQRDSMMLFLEKHK